MNSKEIIENLLKRKLPERYGLYEHFWPETLRDYWPKDGYPLGIGPEIHFNYDIFSCGGWLETSPFPKRREIIQETEEWEIVKDGRGATLKHWKKKSGTPEHIGFEVKNQEIWKYYREPLLSIDRSRIDFEGIRARLALAKERRKFSVIGDLFVFELMRVTIGDENFLPALLLEPEWIKDFCQVYLNFFKKHYELLFREVGLPDGVFIYEDFGYRNGLFCSPEVLRELILPYHKDLVNFFKEYRLPVIIHSCGDIRKAIPVIIDAGYDCLQPMEAKAGCNVIEIAREFKDKIAFMGNIDVTVLNTNNKDKIKEEIEYKMKELKKLGASYVFHSDHSIPPDIKYYTYKYALEIFWQNAYLGSKK